MHNRIIDYYNKHTREFIDRTIEADMSFCQKKFIRLLEPGGLILDAGCGSGRDSKFFLGNGFRVQAMDASIIRKLWRALKPDGILYASFKYGDGEDERPDYKEKPWVNIIVKAVK